MSVFVACLFVCVVDNDSRVAGEDSGEDVDLLIIHMGKYLFFNYLRCSSVVYMYSTRVIESRVEL